MNPKNIAKSHRIACQMTRTALQCQLHVHRNKTVYAQKLQIGVHRNMTRAQPNVTHHWAGGDDSPLESGPAAGSSACDCSAKLALSIGA